MNDIFPLNSEADLAALLKAQRHAQRLTQADAAKLAGISRQHLSEIENSKATHVELPTLLKLLASLRLGLAVKPLEKRIALSQYEQLRQLCWNLAPDTSMTEAEAFAIYERNWRFIDHQKLDPAEKAFLETLVNTYGNGVWLV